MPMLFRMKELNPNRRLRRGKLQACRWRGQIFAKKSKGRDITIKMAATKWFLFVLLFSILFYYFIVIIKKKKNLFLLGRI